MGQVKEQKLCSKVDLQKVKVEHVKKGSTLHIQVEVVDQIYNQKFQVRDQLNRINRSYTFLPTACTTIKDVNLDWNDFAKFYKLMYFTITISKHVITKFLDLLHFFYFWVVYREEKGIPLVGPKHIPPSYWKLGPGEDKQSWTW